MKGGSSTACIQLSVELWKRSSLLTQLGEGIASEARSPQHLTMLPPRRLGPAPNEHRTTADRLPGSVPSDNDDGSRGHPGWRPPALAYQLARATLDRPTRGELGARA